MEKEVIPYEEALALKELGFDEPCFRGWSMEKQVFYHPDSDIVLDNPTFSQAFRWFREKYDIHGIISYYGKGQWFLEVLDYKGNQLIQIENNTFWSYQEAELECLKKLIEIVKINS